jgi:hypothetical protein
MKYRHHPYKIKSSSSKEEKRRESSGNDHNNARESPEHMGLECAKTAQVHCMKILTRSASLPSLSLSLPVSPIGLYPNSHQIYNENSPTDKKSGLVARKHCFATGHNHNNTNKLLQIPKAAFTRDRHHLRKHSIEYSSTIAPLNYEWVSQTESDPQTFKEGQDVNVVDSKGRTTLHFASASGHVESVHHLLESGANPALQDVNGNTPLHLAVLSTHLDIVELLLRYGADVNQKDSHGQSAGDLVRRRLRFVVDGIKSRAHLISPDNNPRYKNRSRLLKELETILNILSYYDRRLSGEDGGGMIGDGHASDLLELSEKLMALQTADKTSSSFDVNSSLVSNHPLEGSSNMGDVTQSQYEANFVQSATGEGKRLVESVDSVHRDESILINEVVGGIETLLERLAL